MSALWVGIRVPKFRLEMSQSGQKETCRSPRRHGRSPSISRRNRCAAIVGRSLQIDIVLPFRAIRYGCSPRSFLGESDAPTTWAFSVRCKHRRRSRVDRLVRVARGRGCRASDAERVELLYHHCIGAGPPEPPVAFNFSIAKVTAITVTLGAGLVGSSTPLPAPAVRACLPAITADARITQTCVYGEPQLATR